MSNVSEFFASKPDRCEVCQRKLELVVDHQHVTPPRAKEGYHDGPVRGWLCKRCNIILGHLEKHSTPALIAAYLSRPTYSFNYSEVKRLVTSSRFRARVAVESKMIKARRQQEKENLLKLDEAEAIMLLLEERELLSSVDDAPVGDVP